jgi:lipopolysaccharide export system protein LptC
MRFNKKESGQVVTTVLGILVVIGIGWLVWQAAKQTK